MKSPPSGYSAALASVQSAAVEALKQLGDKGLLPSLINALDHDNWIIHGMPSEANLGDKDDLISVLNSEDDFLNRGARQRAAEALGKLGDNNAPHLINALNDDKVGGYDQLPQKIPCSNWAGDWRSVESALKLVEARG